ncbi:MAG: ThuA domain-containing protein [Lentisphaeraceae bacterium]|nr:ThuA domain-containing protein [Lentisphaeraceae bacterium]
MKYLFLSFFLIVNMLHAESLRIHLIGASKEYKAESSLKTLKKVLEEKYQVTVSETYTKDKSKKAPNFEQVKDADLVIVFARRLNLSDDNLVTLKNYLASKKPLMGFRTASHAFQNFLQLDQEYFGGSYKGHGKTMTVSMSSSESQDEILNDVVVESWTRKDKPYYNDKNAKDIKVLLTGKEPSGRVHPMAWTRELSGQKVFYTSLGLPEDFQNANFLTMIQNAINWSVSGKLSKK